MARIFIEGFESGDFGLWSSFSGTPTVQSGSDMDKSGTYYSRFNNISATKILSSSKTELYFAFKVKMGTSSAAFHFCLLDSAGTEIFSLVRNTTSGYIEARRGGSGGTLLATGTTSISSSSTYLVELHYIPSNSAGVVGVRVNSGSLEINIEADDLTDTTGGLENIQRIKIAGLGVSTNYNYYDDLVVDDADWVGNTRIQGIVPTEPGNAAEWDASTAPNWDCVDEKPYSDTDYVSTNVTGEVDTYKAGDLSGTISEIKCVQLQARAAKEGSPTPTQLQLIVRPASTDRVSSSLALPISFGEAVYAIWETNPEDSEAWQTADINGMEIGIKAVA